MNTECIFCKIISKQISSNLEYEDEKCIAINDIHPKARIHLLIIPKEHIPTVADINEGKEAIIGHLIRAANKIAKKLNLSGYKLLFNVGKSAGQEVFHVHMHLMAD